jgi:hypothetical protein
MKARVANRPQLMPTALSFVVTDIVRYSGKLVGSLFKLKLTTEVNTGSGIAQLM